MGKRRSELVEFDQPRLVMTIGLNADHMSMLSWHVNEWTWYVGRGCLISFSDYLLYDAKDWAEFRRQLSLMTIFQPILWTVTWWMQMSIQHKSEIHHEYVWQISDFQWNLFSVPLGQAIGITRAWIPKDIRDNLTINGKFTIHLYSKFQTYNRTCLGYP